MAKFQVVKKNDWGMTSTTYNGKSEQVALEEYERDQRLAQRGKIARVDFIVDGVIIRFTVEGGQETIVQE